MGVYWTYHGMDRHIRCQVFVSLLFPHTGETDAWAADLVVVCVLFLCTGCIYEYLRGVYGLSLCGIGTRCVVPFWI